jgi:cytochrome b6-f complex iron-sulfur subunit
MSTALVIAIPVLLVLAAVMIVATGRRRATSDAEGRVTGALNAGTRRSDTTARHATVSSHATSAARERADDTRQRITGGTTPAARETATPAGRGTADDGEVGISRRQFFNRGILVTMALSAGAFGAAAISFLYATSAGGFGGRIDAGTALADIEAFWTSKKAPFYVPEARTYLQPYPKADVKKAAEVPQYQKVLPLMEQGMVALYQKCPHLGCRVPWCQQSQWFECPCHGSKYNRVGEKRGGPAPRGMDHWVATISGQKVVIDTSGLPVTGPPIGTDTTGQGAEGPFCVG